MDQTAHFKQHNPLLCDPRAIQLAIFLISSPSSSTQEEGEHLPRLARWCKAAVSKRRRCSAQATHLQSCSPRLPLWSSPRSQQRVPALREGCSGGRPSLGDCGDRLSDLTVTVAPLRPRPGPARLQQSLSRESRESPSVPERPRPTPRCPFPSPERFSPPG